MATDNGDGLIERIGPKVLQQITVSLLEVSPGVTATNVTHSCPDELACRGLYDKGRVVLDQWWAQQNAPKVVPVNTPLPRLRPLKG